MKTCALMFLFVLAACGGPTPECSCTLADGSSLACSASRCLGAEGVACSPQGALLWAPEACPPPACTPKTACAAGQCGTVSDGCTGTLDCGACGPNACQRAGAVCGTREGLTCGSCPSGSSCASTQRACIETVATLPIAWVSKAAVTGDTLFVAGPASSSARKPDLHEVTLSTHATRRVKAEIGGGQLVTHGGELFFTDTAGLQRVSPGGTPAAAANDEWCATLLVTPQTFYCGVGGDPRYGVSSYGIKKLPRSGGTSSWLVSSLNNPFMSLTGSMLFYVGTTDNFSSFANLGVTDLNGGSGQWLVSGGALESSFIMTDASSYYFVDQSAGGSLQRTLFTAATSTEVIKGEDGIFRDTTVLEADAVFTVTQLGGKRALWKVPLASPATRELVLDDADLGSGQYGVSYLERAGTGWVYVTDKEVFRTVAPVQN